MSQRLRVCEYSQRNLTRFSVCWRHGRVHHRRIGDLLNPARESTETLAGIRLDMGNRDFEAQYQQNPTPSDSQIVDWQKAHFYDGPMPRERFVKVVHSWDVAHSTEKGADYSAGTVWGYDANTKVWLMLDVIRARLAYHDLLARVRRERNHWRADLIIVEKSSVGPALLSELSRDMRCLSEPEHHTPWCQRLAGNPRLPKQERMLAAVEMLYSGRPRFPRVAPWLDEFCKEMLSFPGGRHDDQVDSVSQFLEFAAGRGGRMLLHGDRSRVLPRRR